MSDIPRDVQEFLDGYPKGSDDPELSKNLKFYSNNLPCIPDGLKIEQILGRDSEVKGWQGDYKGLERKHGFIQWLFPIREHGMNYESQPLQPHELAKLKADPRAQERLIASYKLMLDFYGMRLVSEETGAIERAPRYETQYQNLVESPHNYLRISRILKCLSEFGLERLNAGFLLHVLSEQSEAKKLDNWDLRRSMDRWWCNCIRNSEEREWVGGIVRRVRKERGYVFTRVMYAAALEQRLKTGSFRRGDEGVDVRPV
ncbi:opioid growth factor receptor conserved region-domain-containing protein [Mycena maculata]|uniref:Opioid growth factor receptor conserved region-domain-containing protein n=1 Tax=Mycena maculata TaxID=230809 RepID=A0AAD7KAK8_9AGAR|nr:opioid growth factor receptor conserved region-domain-containing protein [Mycena maculata]